MLMSRPPSTSVTSDSSMKLGTALSIHKWSMARSRKVQLPGMREEPIFAGQDFGHRSYRMDTAEGAADFRGI